MHFRPARFLCDLPRPIRLFTYVNAVLAIVCLALFGADWSGRLLLGPRIRGKFFTTPFLPWGHFCDFWNFHDRFDFYHTTKFYSTTIGSTFSYPAPLTLPYALFFLPKSHEHTIFVIATTLPLFGLLWLLGREMVAAGVTKRTALLFTVCTFLFSYPFWFEWELGNIEICVFLIVVSGLLAWLRGRFYLAAALFGVAGSMKLFPFCYLALLLSRKQFRQFLFGIATAAALYVFSLWLACPSIPVALHGIDSSSRALGVGLLPHWDWLIANIDHSIWSFYKQTLHLLGYRNERPLDELSIYTMLAACAGIALYFARIRFLPMMNQLLCLCALSLLLPPMSNDYTLLYMYMPWALLVISTIRQNTEDKRRRPIVLAAFVCFAVLFSPESEFVIAGAAIGGQIKAITLLILVFIGLKYPLPLPSDVPFAHVNRETNRQTAVSVS